MRAPHRRTAPAVLVLLLGGVMAGCGTPSAPAADPSASPTWSTETVTRSDLTSTTAAGGELGHGTTTELAGRTAGTLTWVAPVGSTVADGQTLYAVDTRPVVRLTGAVPAWRDLGPSVADGTDVRQLEQALSDLGYMAGLDLTVDDDWTAVTTTAVTRWQKALGVAQTGTVGVGDAVFTPDDVRVVDHLADLGALVEPGAPVLGVGATRQVVTAALRTSQAALAPVGGTARLTLPDGTTTVGTITAAEVVTVDEKQQLSVTIAPADTTLDGLAEGTPVDVGLDQTVATDVLVVPVTALVALADGGYGVQKVLDDGGTQYVPVSTGAFAGTSVEISGDDVAEGDVLVVTP
ncbi:peptidoglycan-binding protein [Cellulomonas sp. P5_E12]